VKYASPFPVIKMYYSELDCGYKKSPRDGCRHSRHCVPIWCVLLRVAWRDMLSYSM